MNPPIALPTATPSFPMTVTVSLDEPATRVVIRSAGVKLGRAEVLFGATRWAAKHYWTEGSGAEMVTVYEFDEPIPAATSFELRVAAG